MKIKIEGLTIGVVGLGYVGLPLAVEFGKKYETIGFDINENRINELKNGVDLTLECSKGELNSAQNLSFSSRNEDIKKCDVYIVTVPTPIDEHKQPDLTPLISASKTIGQVLSSGNIVIYESTVYPGATEETCIPNLESSSGLKYNEDFFAGYSPERINPGDKVHRVTNILKVTSGSTPEVADLVDMLYSSIIEAGTFKASSIKVAEASKLIENVQRDVNIALINELDQVFNCMKINTSDVIEAASTKWNFMKLFPGLVGGHCIGVDPYYLLFRSNSLGYVPDLIRTARDINDGMSSVVAQRFVSNLLAEKINPIKLHVTLLGFSFKPNCPDVRNTKVYEVYNQLLSLGFKVSICDPWTNEQECLEEYGVLVTNDLEGVSSDVAILMVEHDDILNNLNKIKSNLSYGYIMRLR
jgi:UDP-N-acetyl-D-galactosamine dehydrogenase